MSAPPLYIQDVTLRDGMHAIRHRYSLRAGRTDRRGAGRAGVDAIEITHGDGLAGSSFNYGFGAHTDLEWIEAVADVVTRARVTVLLIPGIGTVEDLRPRTPPARTSVRIATHCTEADISRQHIEYARRLDMDVAGFLMMAHMTPPAELARQAKLMESLRRPLRLRHRFGRRAADAGRRRADGRVQPGAVAGHAEGHARPPQPVARRGQHAGRDRARRDPCRRLAGRHGRRRRQRAARSAHRRR